MFPRGDVPVIQVSMPSLDPQHLFELGTRLRELRAEGILVIGSGFMTHWMGLGGLDEDQLSRLAPFNADFDAWASERILAGDVDALADFRRRGPGQDRAHRTADHFVPVLLAMGAASDPTSATMTIEGAAFTNSKRSFQIS
jgi:4,5-DOPA dioxygenase extradiol